MFMGATEEQMSLLNNAHVDHVSYVLILYSLAFLLFLCKSTYTLSISLLTHVVVNILLHIYAVNSEPASIKLDAEYQGINGHANGRIVRDAEEFELHGLADDDDDLNEEEGLLKENQGSRNQ
jgi:hypothetical protein